MKKPFAAQTAIIWRDPLCDLVTQSRHKKHPSTIIDTLKFLQYNNISLKFCKLIFLLQMSRNELLRS